MNYISYLALYGLLATAQARPEEGYSYPKPQSSLQLSESQLNSAYQQQLRLSQSQQSSSYQQNQPQQLTQLSAPAVQYGVPNFQNQVPQINLQNQYLTPSLQLSQSSLSQQSSQQNQGFFPNFGAQSSLNQVTQGLLQQQDSSQYSIDSHQLPLVTKHIYVHVAPEEPPTPAIRIISHPQTPRKNYKIIFIKAPKSSSSHQEVVHIPPQQQLVEEKTLVYVLVDKQHQPEIIVPTPAPTQPSKPEVYFIKYKAKKAPAHTGSGVDFGVAPQPGLPIVEDLRKNSLINSGESTSSLFSGGLASKYGVPGYQKRSTNEES